MDRKLGAELERLLSELSDEGATRQRVEKIENLLLNNPELQDRYWSWMDNHIILGTDREAILGDSRAASSNVLIGNKVTARDVLPSQVSLSRKYSQWWLATTLAVSACLLWLLLPGIVSLNHMAESTLGSNEKDAWQIPKITRVSWEGPYFAEQEENVLPKPESHVGLVSLAFVNGLPANGYVLRLEPGTSAELMMAADAYAENNLSVTELSSKGTPIRRSVSFNNFGASGVPVFRNVQFRMRRYGLIGTWSEFNDTDKPKYYLINGIHKSTHPDLSSPQPDQEFQLSKMMVVLDEPDLVLLGWDDSGLDANALSAGVEPDGDYDDISVAIQISEKNNRSDIDKSRNDFRMIASPVSSNRSPQTDGADRYRFIVAPGEIAVLKAASEALKTNALFLVREGSGEVVWSSEMSRPGTMNLGAVAIHNTSKQRLEFALFGENSFDSQTETSNWEGSGVEVVHSQPGCSILGFEDEEGPDGDFDDIRITHLSMSPKRNSPFEVLHDTRHRSLE